MQYIHYIVRDILYSLIVENGIDLGEEVICSYMTGLDLGLRDKDYPLIRGPEILLTCNVLDCTGQAFTVVPRNYRGKLADIFRLNLSDPVNLGIFYATCNALLKKLGVVDRSSHCINDEPKLCGKLLTRNLFMDYGSNITILHIGYHPGHIHELYQVFKDHLLITDLRHDIVWRYKSNRLIYDGIGNDVYIGIADIVLVTGSSIVNNTFWDIISRAILLRKKIMVYGITGYGISKLIKKIIGLEINTFCPLSKQINS